MSEKEEFLNKIKTEWYKPELVSVNTNNINELNIDVSIEDECVNSPSITTNKDIVHFYLALNSINHQFWSHNETGEFVRYTYNGLVGAMAMHRGMIDFIESRGGMSHAKNITTAEFKQFFGEMPNINQRIEILNQALSEKGSQLAENLLKESRWGLMDAIEITSNLPLGYKDEALKKAQLALHMISSALNTKGINIDTDLTCFADYQIPRVLRHMGILEYSTEIANKVDNSIVIEADSKEEKAIRAATILACEELSVKTGAKPAEIDFWLWSRRNTAEKPFHLTYTTAY